MAAASTRRATCEASAPDAPACERTAVEVKTIRVRAFIEPKQRRKQKRPRRRAIGPSDWTLVFDTETRVDPGQALRFGVYQLRHRDLLVEHGLFFDPEILEAGEVSLLQRMASELPVSSDGEAVRLRLRQDFVDEVLLRAYCAGAHIVGFNLPFDLSRLALKHSSARREMVGGFTFVLSERTGTPRLQIKRLSQRSAFIQFSNRDKGFFVDVKTFAGSLLGGNHNLEGLCETLGVEHKKVEREDHGETLTADYVRYAITDVQATWECYAKLKARLGAYDLPDVDASHLYSEASLGKAYLTAMKVRPWLDCQDDFPPDLVGAIMCAYFGGRSEVHLRRMPTRVVLCDFLSMYPTVSTLMGLWRFVTAQGVDWRDATEETRSMVATVQPDALQQRALWREMMVLVQVRPDGDLFPIRACYGASGMPSIGLNHLSADRPLWFTLPDVLASKLLMGRTPEIVRAVRFTPRALQQGMRPISIAGRADFRVDPAKDDFYRRIIELRQTVKIAMDQAVPADKPVLDAQQDALKVLANATGYGIFVELNVKERVKKEALLCHFGRDASIELSTAEYEEPGRYFHPLLGALITGAARLMLALAERNTLDRGLDWAFCDTDSLAIARPAGMPEATFQQRTHDVVDWFAPLNPYAAAPGSKPASILQIEKLNYRPDASRELDDLRCIAVSAKRYILYTLDRDGAPLVRKGSQHGLGHLFPPYSEPGADRQKRVKRIKVEKWQEDYWLEVIRTLTGPAPDDPPRPAGFDGPAASRYAASNPELLRWFKGYNEDRSYADQVKPFNFLFSLQTRSELQSLVDDPIVDAPSRQGAPRPAAPYFKDVARSAALAFDRKTGDPVETSALRSLADSIRLYDAHDEAKFWHGEGFERGPLRRRHVQAIAVQPIGKETEAVEVAEYIGDDAPGIVHQLADQDRATLIELVATTKHSVRKICERAGIHHNTLRNAKASKADDAVLIRIADCVATLDQEVESKSVLIDRAREVESRSGIGELAKRARVDPSNLAKMLTGRRRMSEGVAARLRNVLDERGR